MFKALDRIPQLVDVHRIRIFCPCRHIDNLAGNALFFIADGYGTSGGHKFAENLSVASIQLINRATVLIRVLLRLRAKILCFLPCIVFFCNGFFIFLGRIFSIRNAGFIDFLKGLPLRVYSIIPCFDSGISIFILFHIGFPALVFFRFSQVRCHFFCRLAYGSRHITDNTCSTFGSTGKTKCHACTCMYFCISADSNTAQSISCCCTSYSNDIIRITMSAETDADAVCVHGRTVFPQGNSILSHRLISCPDCDAVMYDIFRTHSEDARSAHDCIISSYKRCSGCPFNIRFQSVRFVLISYKCSFIPLIYIIRTDR